MIIDVHTHFFPDFLAEKALASVVDATHGEMRICGDGTLSGLQQECIRQGVNYALTLPVATRPDQVRSINSNLPLQTQGILPFGSINPYDHNWQNEITCLVKLGIQGVKIHPEFQDFYIDDNKYIPFFEMLEKSGLWVLTHAGYDPGPFSCDHATPKRILRLITRHPSLKLIAGHLGGLCQWDDVERYLVGQNVYFDTAAIASLIEKPQFERIAKSHGADKILFGSDYPWESIKESLDFVRSSTLSPNSQKKVLGENAQQLFGLTTL